VPTLAVGGSSSVSLVHTDQLRFHRVCAMSFSLACDDSCLLYSWSTLADVAPCTKLYDLTGVELWPLLTPPEEKLWTLFLANRALGSLWFLPERSPGGGG